MANVFDQFDAPPAPASVVVKVNPFDQFDTPSGPAPSAAVRAAGRKMLAAPDERIAGAFTDAADQPPTSITPAHRKYGFTDAVTASLPFADEITAGGAAGARYLAGIAGLAPEVAFGEEYDKVRALERAALEEYQGQNPGKAALATGLGVLTAGPGSLATAATLPGRMLQGAKAAGAMGAVYGAGEGEGLEDRVVRGGEGLASGVSLGAALPLALAGAGAAVSGAKALSGYNLAKAAVAPERAAAATVARRMAQDGITPEMATARLARADAAGSPMALIDVGGENTRRLGRTVANLPGSGGERMRSFVELRKLEQPERIMDNMRGALGDPALFTKTVDDVLARRAALSKPLYDAAYQLPLAFNAALQSVLKTPAGQRAFTAAQRLAENEGTPLTGMSVRAMDLTKRGLDDMITVAQRAGNNNEARVLTGLKDRLVKEVDRQAPDYALARKVYASESELNDALEKGRGLLKHDPDRLAQDVSRMNVAQREAFQLGAARGLGDVLDRSRRDVVTLMRLPQTQKLLKSAFPDQKAFRQFNATLMREAMMNKTGRAIGGNSTTAAQMADMADTAMAPEVMRSLIRGDFGGAAMAGISKVLAGARGISEKSAESMARMLTSRDPQQIQQTLKVLANRGVDWGQVQRLLGVEVATYTTKALAR